jgi:hypothetical protein
LPQQTCDLKYVIEKAMIYLGEYSRAAPKVVLQDLNQLINKTLSNRRKNYLILIEPTDTRLARIFCQTNYDDNQTVSQKNIMTMSKESFKMYCKSQIIQNSFFANNVIITIHSHLSYSDDLY